jgi:hypothetical protein
MEGGLSDTILKWDYPRIIPAKIALIWFSGFRGRFKCDLLTARPPFRMAAVNKNRNFFNCPLLL